MAPSPPPLNLCRLPTLRLLKGDLPIMELSSLRVRLADLMRLRGAYETVGKRHLVVFIDHLIADVRTDIAILERRQAGVRPAPAKPLKAQDPDAEL